MELSSCLVLKPLRLVFVALTPGRQALWKSHCNCGILFDKQISGARKLARLDYKVHALTVNKASGTKSQQKKEWMQRAKYCVHQMQVVQPATGLLGLASGNRGVLL